MEDLPKKRGRKKLSETVVVPQSVEPVVEKEKKKRGRKKKWETTPFQSNYVVNETKIIREDTQSVIEDDENYTTNNFKFGNLFIKIHDKETSNVNKDKFVFEDTNKDCEINISSDEEDTTDFKVNNTATKKIFLVKNNNPYKNKHVKNNIRCFHCHHFFENLPFYLPIDYCQHLDRYNIFGNFCSPNCVKAFSLNSKTLCQKSYLIGQFYRKLFGPNFTINCAPSIYTLKEYGGDLSIEEFRNSFYKNNKYTLNNLNSKVILLN